MPSRTPTMATWQFTLASIVAVALAPPAGASDWARFRGDNGSGVSPDAASVPSEWSKTKNLKWSVDLPGQGVSCPIVVGDRVYVTCWTGTGPDDLMRHLVCYDRNSGKPIFDKQIAPAAKDESYDQMFTQTGYTAHTPVSDGQDIYCFFGVSGVYKFDLDGNEQWRTSVGTEFGMNHWGTASSPILYKNFVIVPAAAESKSLVALKKENGEEAWKFQDDKFLGAWSTPVLATLPDGRQEVVMCVPGEVWGFDPETGKQLWTCQGAESNSACASVVVNGDVVYAIGGRNGGGMAIRAGGEGDVTGTHVVWSGNHSARIGTALYDDGLVYWISDGIANCVDAESGESIYKKRLEAPKTAEADAGVKQASAEEPAAGQPAPAPGDQAAGGQPPRPDDNQRGPGFGPGPGGPGFGPGGPGRGGPGRFGGGRFGGGRGRGGGFMQADYSSPVIADGKIYFVRRNGPTYVLALGKEFNQLAVNQFEGDEADFSASPAIADGQIFIRSSKKLYCIASVGQL